MFEPLAGTRLALGRRLVPIDLPGFAGTPALQAPTTLERLAGVVHEAARREDAQIVVAHSVASIIVSLAARLQPTAIDTILSLEGNLTAEDAYFSGSAAEYSDAHAFRTAFLDRLDALAKDQPAVARYRRIVADADPRALWELGCDARRFSEQQVPGEVLSETPEVWYLYNQANCPEASLKWLSQSPLRRLRLKGASHWASVDRPDLLSEAILQALGDA